MKMSNHENCTARSNATVLSSLSQPKHLQYDTNTGRSFPTVTHIDSNAPTLNEVALSSQSFAEALHALDESDHRLQPEISRIDCMFDQTYTSANSRFHQTMERMFKSYIDSILRAKPIIDAIQVSEETLIYLIKSGSAAAFAGLKDPLYQYSKNVLAKMTLNGSLEGSFHKEPPTVNSSGETKRVFSTEGF